MIPWGARIEGKVYGRSGDAPWDIETWDTFENHANKQVGVLHFGFPRLEFYPDVTDRVRANSATPLLTLNPELPLEEVAAGKHDDAIREWAQKVGAWGHPLYVRPWWEMNGDWYPWGNGKTPAITYQKAWRKLHGLAAPLAQNIEWVWCPNTISDTVPDPWPWYPGGAYVDWAGMDGYNFGTPWRLPNTVFRSTLPLLPRSKPIMICEVGCTEKGGDKAAWIKDFLGTFLPAHRRIKAVVWFNSNLVENGVKRDWQIESSPEAQAAFKRGIASDYYKGAG